jgi:hypothetical protein
VRYCESCGSKSPDLARFCGSCGHLLNVGAGSAVTDLSTGPLSATEDIPTEIRTVPPVSEDAEQEERDSNALVDIAVPLIPSGNMQVPMGNVPMVQGIPSSEVPMVQGNPLVEHGPPGVQSPPHVTAPPPSPSSMLPGPAPHTVTAPPSSLSPIPPEPPPHRLPHVSPPNPSHMPSHHSEAPVPPEHHSPTEVSHTHIHIRKPVGNHTHPHTHTYTHTHPHGHEEHQFKKHHHHHHREKHKDERHHSAFLSNMTFLLDSTGDESLAAGVLAFSLALSPVSARRAVGAEFPGRIWGVPEFSFSLRGRKAGSLTKRSQVEGGVQSIGGTPSTGSVPMVQGTPPGSDTTVAQEMLASHLHHSPAETHTHAHIRKPVGNHSHPHTHTYTHTHSHAHRKPRSKKQHSQPLETLFPESMQMAQGTLLSSSRSQTTLIPTQPLTITSQNRPPSVQRLTKRKRASMLLLLLLILVGIVLGGSLVFARIISGGPASSATVTITPASMDLKNAYTISVVTGTPDASQNQVGGARILSTATSSYVQTVNATGQGTIPGTQASGTLRVENHSLSTITLNAGMVIPNQYPLMIHMQLDQTVTLLPHGYVDYIPAHVVEVGTIGNLPGSCCGFGPDDFQNQCDSIHNCGPPDWDIFNDSAFTGGTDPQTYTAVQQSDINGAASTLEQANSPNAQQVLQPQVQANEQFIGTPQCKPKVTSDHVAGDQATSVTVTVSFTCTGEVYNPQPAQAMASQLLTTQASTNPGPGYTLVGNIAALVTGAAVSSVNQGTVMLTINAEGVWVYQFSSAQTQALAKAIAGKKKQDVQAFLLKQKGIAKVLINLTGGDGKTLPANADQIKIIVQSVQGIGSGQ